MTPSERVAAAMPRLKVFPLPSAVLLPHFAMPLHIFEPRYRAMVADALAGDGVVALAQLLPGWEQDYAGRPPLHPLCCAGIIAWHEELPDGRFNVLLHGVVRARVLAEHPPSALYREVEAELLPDPPYSGAAEQMLRQALLDLAGRVPNPLLETLLRSAANADGAALADVAAGPLVEELSVRRKILESLNVHERTQLVLSEVEALLARAHSARRHGPLN